MRIKLDIPLCLGEIAAVLGAPLNVKSEKINYIVTDTREANCSDLFFGLSGGEYIEAAKKLGAYTVGVGGDISLEDAPRALLSLASYYKEKLKDLKYTIAITGSVGKTTTKEILSDILSKKYRVHKTQGNFNNILGVSYTILSAPHDCEIMVVELGMNHTGEISELSIATRPNIAIITNIGTAHIGNLGSRNAIAEAKLEIKDGLSGVLIIPDGEALLENEAALRFSTDIKNSDMCVLKPSDAINSQSYKIYSNCAFSGSELKTDATHIASAVSASLLAARQCDCELESSYSFFVKADQNIRQSVIEAENFDILCDFYNASFESFISGFEYVSKLGYSHKSALIGDILELGAYSQNIHYSLGKAAVRFNFDRLYLFGGAAKYVRAGALSLGFPEEKIYVNSDISKPEITAKQINSTIEKNEILYAKASHGINLSRVTELLKESK